VLSSESEVTGTGTEVFHFYRWWVECGFKSLFSGCQKHRLTYRNSKNAASCGNDRVTNIMLLLSLSHRKHLLLSLRFRTESIYRPKHKADFGRNYAEAYLIK